MVEWEKVLTYDELGQLVTLAAKMDGHAHTEAKPMNGHAHLKVLIRGTKASMTKTLQEKYDMVWQATHGVTAISGDTGTLTETEENGGDTGVPRNGQKRERK